MRNILMLFACLFVSSLTAETIGNVEYHLPKQGQGWKVANEIQGTKKIKSTTVVYIPENTSLETSQESFAAHVNNFSTDLDDRDAFQKGFEKGMQLKYANSKVSINFLEKAPHSVLYEWSLNEAGHEKVHGWTRVFATPDETVMLTYQTEHLNNINHIRSRWIQTLKNAKINKW